MTKRASLDRLKDISKQRSIRRAILVPLPIEGVEDRPDAPKTKVEWPVPNCSCVDAHCLRLRLTVEPRRTDVGYRQAARSAAAFAGAGILIKGFSEKLVDRDTLATTGPDGRPEL
jgi:hypothetical protein